MLDCFSSFVDVFALRDGYDSFGWVFLEAKTEGIGEENWGWIKFLRGTKQWIITMLLSRIFLVLQIMEIVLRLFKKKKKSRSWRIFGEYWRVENLPRER